jgi:uncharacterized protein (DUF2147 family)
MRTRLLAAACAALALASGAARAADPAEGDWMIDEGARVHFAPCPAHADRLCGVLAWLKDPNGDDGHLSRDTKNPNPALRDRTILGMAFITDLKRLDSGRWAGGHVYDSDNGVTYAAKMHTHADGTLKFEGCVLVFCGARTWHRPETAALASHQQH